MAEWSGAARPGLAAGEGRRGWAAERGWGGRAGTPRLGWRARHRGRAGHRAAGRVVVTVGPHAPAFEEEKDDGRAAEDGEETSRRVGGGEPGSPGGAPQEEIDGPEEARGHQGEPERQQEETLADVAE